MPTKLKLIIETTDKSVVPEFKKDPPNGANVEVEYPVIEFAETSALPTYRIIVDFLVPIAAPILVNWLLGKFKGSKPGTTITINNQKTEVNNAQINIIVTKIVDEEKTNSSSK